MTDLAVSQRGEEFRLSWTLPGKEEGGRPLRDLTGCRLYRREPLPPAQDCPNCQEGWQLLRAIDLAYLQDFYRQINSEGDDQREFTCPECGHKFMAEDGDLATSRCKFPWLS